MSNFNERLSPSIATLVEEQPRTPSVSRERHGAFELSADLPPEFESESAYAKTRLGMNASWAGNIVLLVAKARLHATL